MLNLTKIRGLIYDRKKGLGQALKIVLSYWYIRIYLIITVLLNAVIWLLSRFITKALGLPQIALHYNIDFGIDLYGDASKIYIIPALGLIIIVINFAIVVYLSRFNPRETRFINHLLLVSSSLVNIILLAAVISVYIVNFR